jgi:hypothetical protein
MTGGAPHGLRRALVGGLAGFAVMFLFAIHAHAQTATLYLAPNTGTYPVGGSFSVQVKINSGGGSVNAAEGTISFNPAQLQVLNVNRTGSIFNLWTTEPTFSNGAGTITFGGGSPAGYTGSAGTVMTIVFRGLTDSESQVSFRSGAVLAADGRGTNVLSQMNGGTYTIRPGTSAPAPEKYVPPSNTPAAPKISSPTHPSPNSWYRDKNPKFIWSVPSNVSATRLLVSKSASAIPTVYYDEPLSERTLENFDEGSWYIHVQLQNSYGWGEVGSFRFRIDSEDPTQFDITEIPREDITNPRAIFQFSAKDLTSGIDHYEVEIDGRSYDPWTDDGSHQYTAPSVRPGSRTMTVRAVDGAGNSLARTVTYEVEGLPAPEIIDYTAELGRGDPMVVTGRTVPNATVILWIAPQGEEQDSVSEENLLKAEAVSDNEGNFMVIYGKRLSDGVYDIFVEAVDARGARSEPSRTLSAVVRPPAFFRFGEIAISVLTTLVTLILLLLGAVVAVLYLWRKLQHLRKGITERVHKAFQSLKGDIEETVAHIDGKEGMSKHEEEINEKLKRALKDAEKHLEDDIEDLKKEL